MKVYVVFFLIQVNSVLFLMEVSYIFSFDLSFYTFLVNYVRFLKMILRRVNFIRLVKVLL